MKFIKQHLVDLPLCYAAGRTDLNGRALILFAPDAYGPCYSLDAGTFERQTVWESPSGTMSMVPLPGANGDFLAVQLFNPGFQAQNAQVVLATWSGGLWQVETLFQLPYVHRFDILERGGLRYILCCTLCSAKQFEQDWSSPGAFYAAELPDDIHQPFSLVKIASGMTRNHGYWRVPQNGFTSALTGCDEGVFEVLPPTTRGDDWQVNRILNRPVSDLALSDIDGDRAPELAVIEPFHGENFNIYHKTRGGYSQIYHHPQNLPFCHAIWGGRLRSQAVFIAGHRSGARDLFLLHQNGEGITAETIDSGCGPANVTVIHGAQEDLLVAANREIGEGAVYFVQDD